MDENDSAVWCRGYAQGIMEQAGLNVYRHSTLPCIILNAGGNLLCLTVEPYVEAHEEPF